MKNLSFIRALKQLEWNIRPIANTSKGEVDKLANGRFKNVAEDVKNFIYLFDLCANKEDNIWFLSPLDYSNETEVAFPWNEFENQSMESVTEEMKPVVAEFWESHLPILMSVKKGYQYVAVGIGETNRDKVYYGSGPEYEETALIAESFSAFKNYYLDALKGIFQSSFYRFIV